MSRASITLAAVACACPALLPAQGAPTRTLSKPEAEFSEPFTVVSGVRELRGGRVIAVDSRDKTVQLLDFASGEARPIGREGSGPGEYSQPLGVYPLPGDSSLVYDPLNQRFLVITPDGKPASVMTMAGGGQGGARVSMQVPRGMDRQGRIYYQGSGFQMTPEGPKSSDSVAVLRYDRGTKKTDTITYIAMPGNLSVTTSGSRGGSGGAGAGGRGMQVMMRMGGGDPFAPQDAWTVTPDGRIAVLRASDYHVDWIGANGARSRGPAIPFAKIRVTEADKKAWRDNFGKNTTMIMRQEGPGGTRTTTPTAPPVQEPEKWSDVKPPFAGAPIAAPDGSIWVARSRAASDPTPTYDVLDATGKVTARVALPAKSRVVGFGNGTVYVVRTDEDDLQYLQRFRM